MPDTKLTDLHSLPRPSCGWSRSRCTSALLLAALAAQALPTAGARAEEPSTCPAEPKREPRFLSKEWRMGKFADFEKYLKDHAGEAGKSAAGAILDTAMSGGGLEDYGKALVSAVMDSYVPGLSSKLSGEPDPLAQQTQVLLDAIADLEHEMIRVQGDGWAEFRSARSDDIRNALEGARLGIRNWSLINGPDSGFAVAATTSLGNQIDRLTYLLPQIERAVSSPGSADDIATFPYLSMLEVYTEVVQLYLLTNPDYVLRIEASDQGVVSSPSYLAAAPSVLAKIDANAAAATVSVMEATIDDALSFADKVSRLDPYRQRANWMVSNRPTPMTRPVEADCGEDTQRAQETAKHMLDVLNGGNIQGCSLFSPCKEPPPFIYQYTVNAMNPDFTTTEEKHCIVADPLGQGFQSTYDGFTQYFSSVDEAFEAHREGTYQALLRTGWGPFAVTLDKWWNVLRRQGLRTGLRPNLALDTKLADYLTNTGGTDSVDFAMRVLRGTVDRQPTARELTLLIGYALEYGYEPLIRMSTEAATKDNVFTVNASGKYPLDDHLRFVMNVRNPAKLTSYYRSLQAARMVPLF
jgi:hypothetical protein